MANYKKVSFRVRKIYYDQIVKGIKNNEIRRKTLFWEKRLLCDDPPTVAVFFSGYAQHFRRIDKITVEKNAEIVLGRPLSEQGIKDVGNSEIIVIWLGEEVKQNSRL
jgi:hypothetical protein